MQIAMWNIEEFNGYKPITTFWEDFSIADRFGISAIKDTFKRAFKEWKEDYKYLTELSLVLNWKCWQYENEIELCQLYGDLWEKVDNYAYSHLKGEEKKYYFRTTD